MHRLRNLYCDLKSVYEGLRDARQTEAERLLFEFRKNAEERFAAADVLIGSLRDDRDQQIAQAHASEQVLIQDHKAAVEKLDAQGFVVLASTYIK